MKSSLLQVMMRFKFDYGRRKCIHPLMKHLLKGLTSQFKQHNVTQSAICHVRNAPLSFTWINHVIAMKNILWFCAQFFMRLQSLISLQTWPTICVVCAEAWGGKLMKKIALSCHISKRRSEKPTDPWKYYDEWLIPLLIVEFLGNSSEWKERKHKTITQDEKYYNNSLFSKFCFDVGRKIGRRRKNPRYIHDIIT